MGYFLLLLASSGLIFWAVWKSKRKKREKLYSLIVAADRGEPGAWEALYKLMNKMEIDNDYPVIREKMYRRLAGEGDTFAMVQLGLSIQNENPTEAYALFCQAANKGNTLAMCALGDGYDKYNNGPNSCRKGFGYDPVVSFQWYKKAATLGDSNAMYWVASAYLLGEGVGINENLAFHWACQGADRGNTNCMLYLADQFYGSHNSRYYDREKAIKLLEQIMFMGNRDKYAMAARSLGYAFRDRKDMKRAAYCFTLSAVSSEENNFELVYKTGYPFTQSEFESWRRDAIALRYQPNASDYNA